MPHIRKTASIREIANIWHFGVDFVIHTLKLAEGTLESKKIRILDFLKTDVNPVSKIFFVIRPKYISKKLVIRWMADCASHALSQTPTLEELEVGVVSCRSKKLSEFIDFSEGRLAQKEICGDETIWKVAQDLSLKAAWLFSNWLRESEWQVKQLVKLMEQEKDQRNNVTHS